MKKLLVMLAKLLHKANRTEYATALLQRLCQPTPSKEVLTVLKSIYYEQGDVESFLKLGQEVTDLYPEDDRLRWAFVWELLAINRPGEALSHLEYLREMFPPSDKIYALLGLALVNLGDWERAEENLERALEIAPWNADAYYGMAELLRRTGRFEEIYPFFESHAKKIPDQFPVHVFAGDFVYYDLFKPKLALDWYTRALELTNYRHAQQYETLYFTTVDLFQSLIRSYLQCLLEIGEKDKARSFLRQEQRGLPAPLLLSFWIDFYFAQEDYKKAESLSRKFVRKYGWPGGWVALALSLAAQRSFGEALMHTQKALKMAPLYGYGWYALASVQQDLKKWDDAISALQRFLTLSPYHPDALGNLGLCFQSKGDLITAIEYYRQALHLRPTNATGWVELGKVYRDIGYTYDAITALERSLLLDTLPDETREYARKLLQELKALDEHGKQQGKNDLI